MAVAPGAVRGHPRRAQGRARSRPKPGIERLDGDQVVFTDGSTAPCDLLIWATGYNVTFPFLDPALVSAKGNDLPLWKRIVHPDLPGLFFIGLLQPLGAVMPLAEAQSTLVADLLTGQYALPADAELRQQMAADDAAYKKRFYASARHTMEVDFDHYLWELERERAAGEARASTRKRTCMSIGGALVTGAGGGLGREIALRLGQLGYTVHVTDVDPAAGRGGRRRGRQRRLRFDVRRPRRAGGADLAALTVEQAGSLELWVNNAGVLFTGPMWEQSQETRQLMYDINILGTSHGMAAALAVMNEAKRGHIVNIVSLAGLSAVPGEAVYSATKHAVMGLSVSTMLDLRIAGLSDVNVSCICPDGMWTPMLYDKLDDPGASMSFSGVLLQPSDVADVVVKVVRKPKPVTPVPAWRGTMARTFDLSPRLTLLGGPLVVKGAREGPAQAAQEAAQRPGAGRSRAQGLIRAGRARSAGRPPGRRHRRRP